MSERKRRAERQDSATHDLLRDLGLLGLGSGLDGQELGVDRGKDTSLRDGDSSDYEYDEQESEGI